MRTIGSKRGLALKAVGLLAIIVLLCAGRVVSQNQAAALEDFCSTTSAEQFKFKLACVGERDQEQP